MSRKLVVLFFSLSLLSCMYLIGRMQSAQAQMTSAKDNPAKAKWEYCAIISSGSMSENGLAVGITTIVYFDKTGHREENVRMQGERVGTPITGEYQRAQEKTLAMTIAQLGSQGWEMVGQLPYNNYFRSGIEQPTALFFKRTKE